MKIRRDGCVWLLGLALLAGGAQATELADQPEPEPLAASPAVVEPAPAEPSLEQKFTQAEVAPFEILGRTLKPGSSARLRWFSSQNMGLSAGLPVEVIHGDKPGPVLCLTAAVHGDELNGIEIARQVLHDLESDALSGTVVGVPLVNMEGFVRQERYIADRRDLNRYFPGNPRGSAAARVAHSLFQEVVRHCDALVDLHTGSYYRENLPQLRADLTNPEIAGMVSHFGAITALQSAAPEGSLRGAAAAAGIPAVVMEVGGPLSLDSEMVGLGVKSVRSLLSNMGMIKKSFSWGRPQPVFYESQWLRADSGGILINQKALGDRVRIGDRLGHIIDPVTGNELDVRSPWNGTVLGRAQNQFVNAGFALFHIGVESTLEELEKQGEAEKREAVRKQVEQLGLKGEAVDAVVDPTNTPEPADEAAADVDTAAPNSAQAVVAPGESDEMTE